MALTGFAIPHLDRGDPWPKNDSTLKLNGDASQWLSAKAYSGDLKGGEVGSFRPEGCSDALGLEPRNSLFPHEAARNCAPLGVITRCNGSPHKLTDRAES
jgi:hypothetical protein